MNAFDWLPQINESRLFRSSTALQSKSAEDIKNIAYLYFTALSVMREEFQTGAFVQDYLTNTFARGLMFRNVMRSDTDLYWALFVIHNQKADFLDPKLKDENEYELKKISLPIPQLRQFIKHSVKGTATVAVSRAFMTSLTKTLRITHTDYKNLGLLSANWMNLNDSQRAILCTRLLFALKKHARLSEIYPEFEKFVLEKRYLIADANDPEIEKKDSTFKRMGKQAALGLAAGAAGAMILARKRESADSFRRRFKSYFK